MTRPCQGPVAAHAPRLAAPAGACDCHAHVFAPLADAPMVDNRGYTPPPASVDDFRAMHRVLGIARAVIVQPSVYGTDNRVTLAAIAAYGARCRGVAVVEPGIDADALAAMHRAGIRGVRLNLSFAGGVGLDSLEAIAAKIASFGWHVQLLIDGRDLPDVAARLRALPVPVVIDHMGHMSVAHGLDHPGFRALLALVGEGAWVKLSGAYRITAAGPPYADVAPVARALIAANPERAVWGTDWPHPAHDGPMPNDGDLLDGLLDWAPDEALRRRILVDNPARLYGFDRA